MAAKTSKRRGKAKLSDPPRWHDKSRRWRKRFTVEGKQKELRYKFANDRSGGKAAAGAWAIDYAKLMQAEQAEKDAELVVGLEQTYQLDRLPASFHAAREAKEGIDLETVEARSALRSKLAQAVAQDDHETAAIVAAKLADSTPVDATTWADALDQFDEDQKARFNRGDIAESTYRINTRNLVRRMKIDWGHLAIPQTEAELGRWLSSWRREQDAQLADGSITKATLIGRAGQLGKFVNWAHRKYLIACPMPRNARDCFRQGTYEATAQAIPLPKLAVIYDANDDRGKLFILLGLNAGFKASDIGRLTISDYDPERGVIDFVRQKTKRKTGGIRIRYKLWKITNELCKEFAQSGEPTDLLFVSEINTSLWAAGKSLITQQFGRALIKLSLKGFDRDGISFGNLRDTGATWFAQNCKSERATYLAHIDSSVGAKYTDAESIDLDKALKRFHIELKKFGKEITKALS